LVPFVSQFATGKHAKLMVYGDDYPTPDGTGVRDYIHVTDLAKGHVAALKNLSAGVNIYNLGTGNGSSVLEVIETFGKVAGKKLPYTVTPRRAGDIAACYTSGEKALNELGWQAEKSLEDALQDAWNWQVKNPDGYGDYN
jgi:UDP-glucose 4-epimerase